MLIHISHKRLLNFAKSVRERTLEGSRGYLMIGSSEVDDMIREAEEIHERMIEDGTWKPNPEPIG